MWELVPSIFPVNRETEGVDVDGLFDASGVIVFFVRKVDEVSLAELRLMVRRVLHNGGFKGAATLARRFFPRSLMVRSDSSTYFPEQGMPSAAAQPE